MTDLEKEKWNDIHPCMLSDKESLSDGTIARRRPKWHSQELSDLIDQLDEN